MCPVLAYQGALGRLSRQSLALGGYCTILQDRAGHELWKIEQGFLGSIGLISLRSMVKRSSAEVGASPSNSSCQYVKDCCLLYIFENTIS